MEKKKKKKKKKTESAESTESAEVASNEREWAKEREVGEKKRDGDTA